MSPNFEPKSNSTKYKSKRNVCAQWEACIVVKIEVEGPELEMRMLMDFSNILIVTPC